LVAMLRGLLQVLYCNMLSVRSFSDALGFG